MSHMRRLGSKFSNDASGLTHLCPQTPTASMTGRKSRPASVNRHLIEGVFDKTQKQEMMRKVTDAMVGIEGEAMRGLTWVRVYEVASGEWGIGGKAITAADVRALPQQGS
jgi:4-oxalocrotonate tautomerase